MRYVIRPRFLKKREKPWTGIQKSGTTGQTMMLMRARRSVKTQSPMKHCRASSRASSAYPDHEYGNPPSGIIESKLDTISESITSYEECFPSAEACPRCYGETFFNIFIVSLMNAGKSDGCLEVMRLLSTTTSLSS